MRKILSFLLAFILLIGTAVGCNDADTGDIVSTASISSEFTSSENTSSKYMHSESVSSENTSSQGISSEDNFFGDLSSENISSEETISGNTSFEHTSSGSVASSNTPVGSTSSESASSSTPSNNTSSGGTSSSNTSSDGTSSDGNGNKPVTFVKQDADNISLYKYCGHWQADEDDPHTYVSYWNVAYVEVDFTGKVIYLEFSKPSSINVSIDGGAFVSHRKISGRIKFEASTDGRHTIQIKNGAPSGYSMQDRIYFAGASVPKGQTLSRTADKKHYIQFIGDSISEDKRSHAHTSAGILDWDYSVAAVSGLSLQTGRGYWGNGNPNMLGVIGKSIGMEDAFFKLGLPQDVMSDADKARYSNYLDDATLNYNFQTGNTPDVVFIFLGTNDGLKNPSDRTSFVKHYSDFVDRILKAYDNKPQIFIMQALSASNQERYTSIDTAGRQIVEKHPENVTFIDRSTVDSWGVELSSDYTHPTSEGYATLANAVAEYLRKYVK